MPLAPVSRADEPRYPSAAAHRRGSPLLRNAFAALGAAVSILGVGCTGCHGFRTAGEPPPAAHPDPDPARLGGDVQPATPPEQPAAPPLSSPEAPAGQPGSEQ